MPIDLSLSLLSSILSIASSVKTLMDARRLTVEAAIAEVYETATDQNKEILRDLTARETILSLTIISKPLLDQLVREVREYEKEHIKERQKNKASLTKKAIADKIASQNICNVLRDIRIHNGGELPDDANLKNWWTSHSCAD